MAWPTTAGWFDELVKLDVRDRTKRTWTEPAHFPSEPIFIPHPDAGSENDGPSCFLSSVLDTQAQRPVLLVLDAASFEELGSQVPD